VSEDVGMPDDERSGPDVPRRARGWVSLYAVAFLLLVGAGVAIVASAAGLLVSTRLLWTSTVLSGLAIVTAIASVVLPRR
jgi:hypothetical protein